ncbi:MAG TPA: hypothetical protein VHF91_08615 [Acidimicrobiales bacterium]|nr:hypothetical protein [Acidimicrobiales bacterium]
MDDPLGDALPVEVTDFLQELVVLQRRRAAGADGALVLVVVDRMTLAVGEDLVARAGTRSAGLVAHVHLPPTVGTTLPLLMEMIQS